MKPQSLITSHSSSVHSCTVSFFLLLSSCPNTQLKSKFSSHCRIDSVWTAKLLNTPSHIYQPTPPLSFTPLCIVSITARCFSPTRPAAFPASYFSVICLSVSLSLLFLFVQLWVSVREALRVGMAAWHKFARLPSSPPGVPHRRIGKPLFTVNPFITLLHVFFLQSFPWPL